jgi:hypothetical protein
MDSLPDTKDSQKAGLPSNLGTLFLRNLEAHLLADCVWQFLQDPGMFSQDPAMLHEDSLNACEPLGVDPVHFSDPLIDFSHAPVPFNHLGLEGRLALNQSRLILKQSRLILNQSRQGIFQSAIARISRSRHDSFRLQSRFGIFAGRDLPACLQSQVYSAVFYRIRVPAGQSRRRPADAMSLASTSAPHMVDGRSNVINP